MEEIGMHRRMFTRSYLRSTLAVCALLALSLGTLQAQGPFAMRLRQPPPNMLRLSDLWEVDLFNQGRTTVQVYMTAVVEQGTEGTVVTSTTTTFSLPPGTKTITASNASQLSPVSTQYVVSRYRDALRKTSQFPSGSYTVSVTLRATAAAAAPELARDAIDQRVELASGPILITPTNESTVEMPLPVFTWASPGPMSVDGSTTFTLKIVEILARQSADAAMLRNRSWYQQEKVYTTNLQFPVSARAFQTGKRYAWTVYAYNFDVLVGQSEVWEFTYQPPSMKRPALPKVITVTSTSLIDELLRSCSDDPKK